MTLVPVKSSNLAAVGYDAKRQVLRVQFVNGSTYDYHGVEPELHEDLLAAPSIGGFFHREIRSKAAKSADERTGRQPYWFERLELVDEPAAVV